MYPTCILHFVCRQLISKPDLLSSESRLNRHHGQESGPALPNGQAGTAWERQTRPGPRGAVTAGWLGQNI